MTLTTTLKRTVCGVGINDVPGLTNPGTPNRTLGHCYILWSGMLARCYNPLEQAKRPTYIGCTVDPRWHYLSNFKQWYDEQGDVTGKQLDKDIISPGNKVYGPDTCFFVSSQLNSFFTKRQNDRGKYPIGVYIDHNNIQRPFKCQVSIGTGKRWQQCHDTPEEAHQAFIKIKKEVLLEKFILPETDQRLKQALYNVYNNMEEYFK